MGLNFNMIRKVLRVDDSEPGP